MARGAPNRTIVASVSACLGAVSWFLGLWLGPGPTALNVGGRYLLILGAAGFIVAVIERDLSWTSLAGLYAGQLAALFAQSLLRPGLPDGDAVAWLPFFILSATLLAAIGGALGAVAADGWRALRARAGASSPVDV